MTFEAEVERVAVEQRFSSNMYKPEGKRCALFRSWQMLPEFCFLTTQILDDQEHTAKTHHFKNMHKHTNVEWCTECKITKDLSL